MNLVILNRGQLTRTTPELANTSPNFRTTLLGGRSPSMYDLTCIEATCTVDLQWNWVSSLEPSGPEAETLPRGHRGPYHMGYTFRAMGKRIIRDMRYRTNLREL
ncbi:hypothetical protein AVEN_165812-1 [Araneus ventricosus]|uniref:Uncharacterized protein n=1 Tax=Araneus ventricosus TaxID=182803 RepID=A0A4Y2EMX1_ARAVE|nr:hypothetical protein AVEN_165812-1 [Araneus ventricosus]